MCEGLVEIRHSALNNVALIGCPTPLLQRRSDWIASIYSFLSAIRWVGNELLPQVKEFPENLFTSEDKSLCLDE